MQKKNLNAIYNRSLLKQKPEKTINLLRGSIYCTLGSYFSLVFEAARQLNLFNLCSPSPQQLLLFCSHPFHACECKEVPQDSAE